MGSFVLYVIFTHHYKSDGGHALNQRIIGLLVGTMDQVTQPQNDLDQEDYLRERGT
jgi:hypothetical protein